jgi:hypothetical protein
MNSRGDAVVRMIGMGILAAAAALSGGDGAAQQVAGTAVESSGQAAAPSAPAAAAQAQPPACAAGEYAQFDFWVGHWDVYRTGGDRIIAHSLVEKLYDGCGVRENWMPLGQAGGGSLNSYVPQAGEWRQIWIDSSNSWAEFRGGVRDGAMVLSGTWRGMNGPGSEPLVRISYIPQPEGAVRQFGEQSTDAGRTWTPAFDLTYRRSATAAAAPAANSR